MADALSPSDPNPSPSINRTTRRRERTRRELIDAARTLITEHGVAGLRVGDLTETADVGRGSFYNHFKSIDELVSAVVSETLESLGSTVVGTPQHEDPIIAASIGDRRAIRLAYDNPNFARLMVNLDHSDDVFAAALIPHARIAVQRGIDEGRFCVPDLDIAMIMLAGGAIAVIRAILDGRAPADADIAHAEATLISFGLNPEDARAISRYPLP